MASLKRVTRLYGQLLRRLWLAVACLTLALAPASPSPIGVRDASALSIGSPGAEAPTRSTATKSTAASTVAAHGPVQPEPHPFESQAAVPRARELGPPRSDGRYLYLELLTLLS